MSSSSVSRFLSIGLDDATAQQTAAGKVGPILEAVIDESGLKTCDKSVGILLLHIASTLNPTHSPIVQQHRKTLVKAIVDGRVKARKQVDEGIKYLKKVTTFSEKEFETAMGVGVTVSDAEILSKIDACLKQNEADLKKQGYKITGKLLGQLTTTTLLWAEGSVVKTKFDEAILKMIGPKPDYSEEKKAVPPTPAGTKAPKKETPHEQKLDEKQLTEAQANIFADLSFLDEGRPIAEAKNTPEQLAACKAAVGDKIITRFPPEPNGFLHIGHAKAMRFNFGIAKSRDGDCIMRFDDTNPEAEKTLYIDNILENVDWLGHKRARTTYSSDYFPQLYELAIKLIKKGLAYVCHQTAEEIEESRQTKIGSPFRDRPIEESLKLFEDMRKGKFAEGKATLRMKGDMNHPNPQMWDVVAYRIKYTAHPHVGNKWCIYPSYDYTHCIIDSLEWVTYSCCTLEFEVRRESYFWLLWHLDLYKPRVWEYSRLCIEHNVLSKRRLLRLVCDNHVKGWDDPRLLTLNGLRRRGFTADAINHFCDVVGVSRTQNMIPYTRLEYSGRLFLDSISRRVMVVENPIKVTLLNYPEGKVETLKAPDWPQKKEPSEQHPHDVPFSRVLYIDASDVRLIDDKDFFGLAPGKEVHLKYAYNITAKEIKTHADGSISEVIATVDVDNKNKPKGKIHWVAEPRPGVAPLRVELRLYEVLFKSADPMAIEDWVTDLNPNSLTTVYGYADPSLASAKPRDHFQFERNAFFACDDDSTASHLVFNRTVSLKESKTKSDEPKAETKKENGKAAAATETKNKKTAAAPKK